MDTWGTIFIRPVSGDKSLKEFACQMFAWLGMPSFKEDQIGRDDIPVFVGSAVGITVMIAETTFKHRVERFRVPRLEKYPFVISLTPQGTSQAADYLVQHAHVLAWRLSHEGFQCFVPKEATTAKSEEDGMVYDC